VLTKAKKVFTALITDYSICMAWPM